MELKKNPKVDLSRKRGLFFNISLAFVLFLVNTAFEWRTSGAELIDLSDMGAGSSKIELFDHKEAQPEIPQPLQPQEVQTPQESPETPDEDEIMIKVNLDIALEGDEFDNTFLDELARKS